MTGAEPAIAAAVAPELFGLAAGTATGAALGTGATAATLGSAGATFGALAGAPLATAPMVGLGGGTAALFGATPEVAAAMGSSALIPGALPEVAAAATPGMGGGIASLFGPTATGGMPASTSLWNPKMANMAGRMGSNMLNDQGPQPVQAQRPPQTAQPTSTQDILARLQRGMGPRSNMAGLLGQAIGGGYGRY